MAHGWSSGPAMAIWPRVNRGVLGPSSLQEVNSAVVVAAAEVHNVYMEQVRGGSRRTLCH